MKKWLLGVALAVTSAIAFALPSPHQIEDALAAKDYDSARSMVTQVLQEKPDSARAHLLDAFILEHVDHNLQAANTELANASNLDRRGDVKNSSLFGRTVAEIDSQAAQAPRHTQPVQQVAQNQQQPLVAYQAPPEKHSSHVFLWLILFFGVVGVLAYFLIRGAYRKTVVQTTYYDNSPGLKRLGSDNRTYISTPVMQPAIVHQPAFSGGVVQPAPVIINNGGGYGRGYGNDGFTEGLIMGEILEDSRESRRERDRRDSYSSGSNDSYTPAPYVAPEPTPSPVSYSNERSSYSSGSDDSWSSRSSSSDSYSSSSSSSSWDSGSSSSSYDSGSSSYDSGSSGGSDW
jgi:uncharacterized membrane protein YgcG